MMPRVRIAILLAMLTSATLTLAVGAGAQANRRAVVPRAAAARTRVHVFGSAHPGGTQKMMAAPAVPPIPDFEKMQMTTYSLPGADVHAAGGTIRLTASQPVAPNGVMSVEGAVTQPIFGQDGSILFDDLAHRPAGRIRLRVHLAEANRPHVIDCGTIAKPDVDWEFAVGNDVQVIKLTAQAFTPQHLNAIIVPAQAGDFEITLHPTLAAPRTDYVYTTIGYCEVTVLH